MEALWIKKFGAPDVLSLENKTPIDPNDGEVQIAVSFTGINFAEIIMRQGLYQDAPPKPLYRDMNLVVLFLKLEVV